MGQLFNKKMNFCISSDHNTVMLKEQEAIFAKHYITLFHNIKPLKNK